MEDLTLTLTCSLVVATRSRPRQLVDLLRSLDHLPDRPTEVIVVDDSPGDPATRATAAAHATRYLTAGGVGLSAARNAGARAAGGDIVAFLDDDAIPLAHWLPNLLAPFVDDTIVAAAGRIVPLDVASPAQEQFAAHGGLDLGPVARTVSRDTPRWFEICNFGGVGSGGNLAIRRTAFEVWEGFRESLGLGTPIPGSEEHHAFFTLVRLGYRVAYAADAVAAHPYPASMAAARRRHLQALTAFTAYVSLLLVEEPEYRRRVMRYLMEAARGTPREWRTSPSRSGVRLAPLWVTALALMRGPISYARLRIVASVRSA